MQWGTSKVHSFNPIQKIHHVNSYTGLLRRICYFSRICQIDDGNFYLAGGTVDTKGKDDVDEC